MSNKPYKGFEPKWLLTPAPENSYRSIFRWGDPNFFKYPKESLYTLMKEKFQMTDDDFKAYSDDTGFDPVELPDHPVQLAAEHIEALKKIVGEQNISTTDYDRLSVAYGATAYDLLRLRHKRIDSVPDVVLYPETSGLVALLGASGPARRRRGCLRHEGLRRARGSLRPAAGRHAAHARARARGHAARGRRILDGSP